MFNRLFGQTGCRPYTVTFTIRNKQCSERFETKRQAMAYAYDCVWSTDDCIARVWNRDRLEHTYDFHKVDNLNRQWEFASGN